MPESDGLVRKQYQDLYADYYRNPAESLAKREISAQQSVAYLTGTIGDAKFHKLLDVGAGDGSVLAELSRRQVAEQLFAVEISASGVAVIEDRRLANLQEVKLFDGYHLPYPDKHFDLAIALHVLEHVEHERLLLLEMKRVAKRIYIEVPLELGFKVRRSIAAGRPFGHINFFTPETLRSLIESCGITATEFGVRSSSLRYEQHVSGRIKGLLKNSLRNLALAIAPNVAPWFVVYNGFAYCECS